MSHTKRNFKSLLIITKALLSHWGLTQSQRLLSVDLDRDGGSFTQSDAKDIKGSFLVLLPFMIVWDKTVSSGL